VRMWEKEAVKLVKREVCMMNILTVIERLMIGMCRVGGAGVVMADFNNNVLVDSK